jgi:hypothetical protein
VWLNEYFFRVEKQAEGMTVGLPGDSVAREGQGTLSCCEDFVSGRVRESSRQCWTERVIRAADYAAGEALPACGIVG